MKNSIFVPVACSIILVFIVSSFASALALDKSFAVQQGGTLYVDTESGSISVSSHERDTVEVQVKMKGKNADDFKVEFSKDGNDVKVTGEKKRGGLFSFGGSRAHFIVKVPQKYNVDLNTSGGSLELSSVTGEVNAYTSGGSITLDDVNGDVNVKTSGGSIKAANVDGRLNARTSGGSINVKLSKQPTGDNKLTTSGGSITAYLLPSVAIDLYASTSGGSVSSQFEVNGAVKRTKIDGEINGGGPRLYLKTSGGSVRIKQL